MNVAAGNAINTRLSERHASLMTAIKGQDDVGSKGVSYFEVNRGCSRIVL